MILAERAARVEAEAVAVRARALNSRTDALIAHLKLEIEKLKRELYGTRSERKARLLEQMELQLEDLEASATEDELAAEKAVAKTQTVKSFQRKRPSRKPCVSTSNMWAIYNPYSGRACLQTIEKRPIRSGTSSLTSR